MWCLHSFDVQLLYSLQVELVSHFGSEHYCPLSLLRVLGTSFIQEYEDAEDELSPPAEASGVILDGEGVI